MPSLKTFLVILAPYYFSHKLSLQLAGAKIHVCPFEKATLKPDWSMLRKLMEEHAPKMVVLTTPNNPSGVVWDANELKNLVDLCRQHNNTWLCVDQTYHDFIFDGNKHVYPCKSTFQYENIIHIFSMSKSFGMPGWRVGYVVYPKELRDHMRKVPCLCTVCYCIYIVENLLLYY